MKEEDTKENAMEAQRVFIENLPKPKRWWQGCTVIIAFLALVVSVSSMYLLKQEFIIAHRPYVYVNTLSKMENGKSILDDNTVVNTCLNAPAQIINRELYYVTIKTKENGEEEVSKIPVGPSFTPNKFILYPSEEKISQTVIDYDFKKEILEKNPKAKLKREIRIDYKELSSDRTYHFEGYWDYNRQYNVWEPNSMFGN